MTTATVLSPALLRRLRQDFTLDWRGIHGAPHWARVRENGLRLAAVTGARTPVVELFAFLHDSRRADDGADPFHGARAARFAAELRGALFELDDAGFALLRLACERHSDGLLAADVTVQTCWDADRLDLGRVGKRPDPARLCTAAAREPATLAWAYARSIRGTVFE
jgi:uncharacterized protein